MVITLWTRLKYQKLKTAIASWAHIRHQHSHSNNKQQRSNENNITQNSQCSEQIVYKKRVFKRETICVCAFCFCMCAHTNIFIYICGALWITVYYILTEEMGKIASKIGLFENNVHSHWLNLTAYDFFFALQLNKITSVIFRLESHLFTISGIYILFIALSASFILNKNNTRIFFLS